jgi:hypothetical protein
MEIIRNTAGGYFSIQLVRCEGGYSTPWNRYPLLGLTTDHRQLVSYTQRCLTELRQCERVKNPGAGGAEPTPGRMSVFADLIVVSAQRRALQFRNN